jgi:penicillin-binding protein 1C
MTDKPGKPSETPRPEGGWYVPGGAGQKPTPSANEPEVPMPTNTKPETTGGWYVPPEAKPLPQAAPVQPAQPAEPAAPTVSTTPTPASTTTQDSEEEFDYDNYVPGKGFVKGEATAAVPEASETAPIPAPEPEQAEDATTAPEAATNVFQPTGVQPAIPVARLEPSPTSGGGVRFERLSSEAPIIPNTPTATGGSTPPPSASLQDKYTNVEIEVQGLRRKYRLGNMTADDLRGALRKLMVLDDTGNWWMIGMESDRWYKYDGRNWVQADPPGHASGAPTLTSQVSPSGFFSGSSAPATQPPPPNSDPALPKNVPIYDDQATVVGKAAPYLDPTLRSSAVQETPTPADATLASRVRSDQYGSTIPSPIPNVAEAPLQPDYGDSVTDPRANRGQLAGVMARLAILSLVLVMGCALLVVLGAIGYYYSVVNQFSDAITNLATNVQSQPQDFRIHDATGRVIATVSDKDAGKRIPVTLDQVSPYLIHAVVSTEDQRFYDTPGFDIVGIVRAVFQNLSAGNTVSGASSITQQLARAVVFDPNEVANTSTQRKIIEIFVASEISRRYTKSQILEMYLNQIPLGNRSNGVEAAAQNYFSKSAKDLNVSEAGLIAGLIQAPSAYNPVVNIDAAVARMREVFRLMVQNGCIQMQHASQSAKPFCVTQATIDQSAIQTALVQTRKYTAPENTYQYPHFVNFVIAQLEQQYGAQNLYKLGYDVYTTLDPNLQDVAENAIKQQVTLLRNNRVYNGAVFAINPQNGAILAMVGSANYNDTSPQVAGQYNVVIASRQPGSSIKPIMYAGAFERNPTTGRYLTPATILWDVQTEWPNYRPVNYDGRFRGPVSLRTALGSSLNIPAVRAMDQLGVDRFKDVALRLGLSFPLTQPETAGLSTALGSTEVRLYDMVRAYGAFANGGKRFDQLIAIARITRKVNGQDVAVFDIAQTPPNTAQAIEPAVAFLINSILSDNDARTPAFGRNSILNLADGRPAAVKTGTTNDFKDNWTIGYTPDVVVGAWVGNSDGTPMFNVSGIQGAAPIWNQVMTAATRGKAVSQFPIPAGVAQAQICADYGVALDDNIARECPQTSRRNEIFIAANPPSASTDIIRTYQVDTFTGLIANDSCPDYTIVRRYLSGVDNYVANWLNNTNDGRTWAANHTLPTPITLPPTGQCDATTPRPNVGFERITANQTVAGLVPIYGHVDVPNFASYQLQVAQAERPQITVNISEVTGVPRPTPDSFLGSWDTTRVSDGNYILYIRFNDKAGHYALKSIAVTVNNTNPPPGAFSADAVPTNAAAIPNIAQPTQAPVIIPTSTPFGPPPTRPLFAPTATRSG